MVQFVNLFIPYVYGSYNSMKIAIPHPSKFLGLHMDYFTEASCFITQTLVLAFEQRMLGGIAIARLHVIVYIYTVLLQLLYAKVYGHNYCYMQ